MELGSSTEMEHDGFIAVNEMLSVEMGAFDNEDDADVDDPLSFHIPDHFINIQNSAESNNEPWFESTNVIKVEPIPFNPELIFENEGSGDETEETEAEVGALLFPQVDQDKEEELPLPLGEESESDSDYEESGSKRAKTGKRKYARKPVPKEKCKNCGEMFKTEKLLQVHTRFRHEPVNCELCSKTLLGKKGLFEHVTRVHQEQGIFRCKKCTMIFPTEVEREKHLRTFHKN